MEKGVILERKQVLNKELGVYEEVDNFNTVGGKEYYYADIFVKGINYFLDRFNQQIEYEDFFYYIHSVRFLLYMEKTGFDYTIFKYAKKLNNIYIDYLKRCLIMFFVDSFDKSFLKKFKVSEEMLNRNDFVIGWVLEQGPYCVIPRIFISRGEKGFFSFLNNDKERFDFSKYEKKIMLFYSKDF